MIDQEIQLLLDEKQDEILTGMPVPQDGKIGDIRTNVAHKGRVHQMMKVGVGRDAWRFSAPFTRTPSIHTMDDYLLKSGGKMLDGAHIAVDEIRARDGDGLKLYDDAGVIGSGLFLKDGGDFGVGIDPSYKFSIGSTDGSDQIGIYHDNTNAHFRTTDGAFRFQSEESANTAIEIRSVGGVGIIRVFDESLDNFLYMYSLFDEGVVTVSGISPGNLSLYPTGLNDVSMFRGVVSGRTRQLFIYGYRAGDALRSLQIGVGVDAPDTASFDGLSNYYFDGSVGFGILPLAGAKATIEGSIKIKEQAAAGADTAAYGQLWTKDNAGTTELWFTQDDGTDHQIAYV